MALTDSLKTLRIETAKSLQGSARRLLMVRTVQALGPGGQQHAARELRWGRMTMRKGMRATATIPIRLKRLPPLPKRYETSNSRHCPAESAANSAPTPSSSSARADCLPW